MLSKISFKRILEIIVLISLICTLDFTNIAVGTAFIIVIEELTKEI